MSNPVNGHKQDRPQLFDKDGNLTDAGFYSMLDAYLDLPHTHEYRMAVLEKARLYAQRRKEELKQKEYHPNGSHRLID